MFDYFRSSYNLGEQFTNVVCQTKDIEDGIGGTMTEITWSKADDVSQMTLTDAAGNVVHPAPGKTWVELITTSGDATFTPSAAPSASPSKS